MSLSFPFKHLALTMKLKSAIGGIFSELTIAISYSSNDTCRVRREYTREELKKTFFFALLRRKTVVGDYRVQRGLKYRPTRQVYAIDAY